MNSRKPTKDPDKRKIAHSSTYLIGNLISLCFLWIIASSLLWYFVQSSTIFKIVTSAIVLVILAWIEHRYLTGLVGWVVEKFFSDPLLTAQYEENISRQKMREEKLKTRKKKRFEKQL